MTTEEKKLPLKRILLAGCLAVVLMFIVSLYGWQHLQEGKKIPVHWGIDGQPDRYGSIFEGLFLIPLICAGLTVLFCVIPYFEPRRMNLSLSAKAYTALCFSFFVFLVVIHLFVVLAALNQVRDMNTIVPIGVGMLLIVIGNYMGKIRSNFFCGIRTPWTLSSELSWNKTHRLGGKLFILMGFVFIVASLFTTGKFQVLSILITSLLLVAIMVIYSYVVWKNDPDKQVFGQSSKEAD